MSILRNQTSSEPRPADETAAQALKHSSSQDRSELVHSTVALKGA